MATACLAQPTSTQIQFCEPAIYFSLETWLLRGSELIKHGKRLEEQEDCRQWDIGDWLISGEESGVRTKAIKEKAFKKYALEITKYNSWGSLKNLMTIARRVPDGPESRRRDGREGRKFLSYAIHVEVAKFDDETQEQLLEHAEKEHSSVRLFKNYIARAQDIGHLPKIGKVKLKKPTSKGYKLQVFVTDVDYTHFCRLSLALGPPHAKRSFNSIGRSLDEPMPEAALFWCAVQYVKEHKAELLERVAQDQKKRAEDQRIDDLCHRKLPPS
jgi:hypothetical protein